MNSKMLHLKNVLTKNSPTILTGVSVAGLISTTILAVKATPKALAIIEIENDARRLSGLGNSYLTKSEIVKATWKCYIPTAIMGGATIACIVGGNNVNLRRNAALASMYSLTEASLKEYQAKVVEVIGEGKATKIKDEIKQDRINRNPQVDNEVTITERGEQLCYDSISGRYFTSDIEQIRRVQNDLNRSLLSDMWCSLNELYYGLGLSAIGIGDEMGWTPDAPIEIEFSSMITPNNSTCLVLDYWTNPKYDYREY